MSTCQRVEMELSETQNGDSAKKLNHKNKSKKFKSKKEKWSHSSRDTEALLWNDDAEDSFEVSATRKKAKKSKRHKDEHHQRQKKYKDKSESQDSGLLPRPVKRKRGKKSKCLAGSDQTDMDLLNQQADTSVSRKTGFSKSGRDEKRGSLRSQHPAPEGSYLMIQEPKQAHIHPKSSKGNAPLRKRVVFDPLPCSLDFVGCQVKKQKRAGAKCRGPETSAPVPSGKEMLLKSSIVPRKAHLSLEELGGALHQLRKNGCKASQLTAESYNSQDLFITQNTFLPVESSSDESVSMVSIEPRDRRCSGAHLQTSQQFLLAKSTAEKATQTHDFFSSLALSTSFRFCKLYQEQACVEQALDLSLPKRLHGEPSSVPAALQLKQEPEEASCEDILNPNLTSAVANEENRTLALDKAGVAHLKVVQTRLNESFFFKMKGDGESPKPQSPLMGLAVTKSKMSQLKLTMKARRPSDLNSWSHSKH